MYTREIVADVEPKRGMLATIVLMLLPAEEELRWIEGSETTN